MLRALKAEVLKLKRARVPMWTALAVCLMPLLAVLTAKLTDGELAHVTWEEFMRAGPEMIASAWGLLVFGLATAYVFGREFEDGTAKYMLTLPLRREYFVAAKMVVLAAWVLGLTILAVAVEAGYAAFLGLKGFAWGHIGTGLALSLEVSAVLYLTLPVVALLALLGKGYLPPMLFSALMMVSSMMLAIVGWARWFPWSMPTILAGMMFGLPDASRGHLGPESWVIAVGLFVAGSAAVLRYVDTADNAE
jgi:ABC-2 type transport system permease protein